VVESDARCRVSCWLRIGLDRFGCSDCSAVGFPRIAGSGLRRRRELINRGGCAIGGTPDPNCVEELPIRSQLKDLQSLCGIVRAPFPRHRSLAAPTGPISRQCSPPSSLPSPSQFHRRPPSPPAPRLRTFLPAPRQPVASSPSAPSPALASFPGNTSK